MNEFFLYYNHPYLIALILLFIVCVLELIALLIGITIFSHIDVVISSSELSLGEDFLSQGLSWLMVGRLPTLVLLVIFLASFSLVGITVQGMCVELFGSPLNSWIVIPLVFFISVMTVRMLGKLLARWIPQCENFAVSEDCFIGKLAVITGATARPGKPTECKLIDEHRQVHYLLVEPQEGCELNKNDRVLIVEKLSDACFLAEINPWPEHL